MREIRTHGLTGRGLETGSLYRVPRQSPTLLGRGTSGLDRRRFFSIARGSALECAALLDILASRGRITLDVLRRARSLLVRVVQMLSKMTQSR